MAKLHLGGQAVIEGVLIRSPHHYSVAVRKPDGSISVKRERIKSSKLQIAKVPFFRGVFALWDTLDIGFRALMYSANESSGENEKLGKTEVFATIGISILLAVALFIALPFYLSVLVAKNNSLLFNVIDGLLKAAVLVGYLFVISLFPDVKVMFQYHGAEHMAIHSYEAGKGNTVKDIRRFKTMHPRCGTSFLLFVLLLGIIVFSVVHFDNLALRFASRIILLPVIAAISYEVLKFSARHSESLLTKPLILPGILLQKITTKQPTDRQIEVAMASVKDVIEAEGE